MVLLHNLYLTILNYSFTYIEGSFILLFTKVNTKKMKFVSDTMFFVHKSCLSVFKSIISILYSNIGIISTSVRNLFFSTLLGYTHGFRLIGRGYKSYLDLNSFLFRLGYSHNIYYTLPFYFKGLLKPKFKKFWLIRSFNYLSLSRFVYFIKNFRIPNKYMHKGIYVKNNTKDYSVRSTKIGML